MPTTAQDYISKTRKTLTLPSGAVFTVRRPNALWFGANLASLPTAIPGNDALGDSTPESREANIKLNRKIICEHVLDPKFTETGELTPDDLTSEDTLRLLNFLFGLEDENGVSFRALPQQRVDDTSGANGGTVPLSA